MSGIVRECGREKKGGGREGGKRETFQQQWCFAQLPESHDDKECCVISRECLWISGTLIIHHYLHIVAVLQEMEDMEHFLQCVHTYNTCTCTSTSHTICQAPTGFTPHMWMTMLCSRIPTHVVCSGQYDVLLVHGIESTWRM